MNEMCIFPHVVYAVRQIKVPFQNEIIRAAGFSLNVNNVQNNLNFHPSNKQTKPNICAFFIESIPQIEMPFIGIPRNQPNGKNISKPRKTYCYFPPR